MVANSKYLLLKFVKENVKVTFEIYDVNTGDQVFRIGDQQLSATRPFAAGKNLEDGNAATCCLDLIVEEDVISQKSIVYYQEAPDGQVMSHAVPDDVKSADGQANPAHLTPEDHENLAEEFFDELSNDCAKIIISNNEVTK